MAVGITAKRCDYSLRGDELGLGSLTGKRTRAIWPQKAATLAVSTVVRPPAL
jgi:hypothetical protein